MVKIRDWAIGLGAWLAQALIIQLFLLSLSFPVLVSWGIAFSPLVFIGNIVFTPILILFLSISCAIYISELLLIPNYYLCVALNTLVNCWMLMLLSVTNIPLIGCPQAPFWILMTMPLGAWCILKMYGFKNSFLTSCLLMCWVAAVFFGIKWYYTPISSKIKVSCGNRSLTLALEDKKIIFIDSESALASRACSSSWIEYTLSSMLVKNFGATTIDLIVVAKSTPAVLKRLESLCRRYNCTKVVDMQGVVLQIQNIFV